MTEAELASVAFFARLSRAFLLANLFRRFKTRGPISVDRLVHSLDAALMPRR